MPVTDAERLDVKVFVAPGTGAVEVRRFMPIFQRWIQEDKLPGVLLDVADYTHVPNGPGMVLVSHEGQYVMDAVGGRLGLLYSHRRGVAGDFEARVTETFRRALRACVLIEDEPSLEGRVRFTTGEMLFRVNYRLLASDAPDTLEALRPGLAKVASALFGSGPVAVDPLPTTGAAFSVLVRGGDSARRPRDLVTRLGG
jgi:hypothetical protein